MRSIHSRQLAPDKTRGSMTSGRSRSRPSALQIPPIQMRAVKIYRRYKGYSTRPSSAICARSSHMDKHRPWSDQITLASHKRSRLSRRRRQICSRADLRQLLQTGKVVVSIRAHHRCHTIPPRRRGPPRTSQNLSRVSGPCRASSTTVVELQKRGAQARIKSSLPCSKVSKQL